MSQTLEMLYPSSARSELCVELWNDLIAIVVVDGDGVDGTHSSVHFSFELRAIGYVNLGL